MPQITANSYSSSTIPTNWWVNALPSTFYMVNGNDASFSVAPYDASQAIIICQHSSISQAVQLSTGNYKLSFYSRSCSSYTINDISVSLSGTDLIALTSANVPPGSTWTKHTVYFTISSSETYKLLFQGLTVGNNATAIDNVSIVPNNIFSIYRDVSANSVKVKFVSSNVEINSKLFDYSANSIYNLFISTANYGNTTSYGVCVYDNSNVITGNPVNWTDMSNNMMSLFSDYSIGRASI